MLTVKPRLLYEASRTERRDRMVSDPGDQSGMRQRQGEQDVVVAPDLGVEGGTAGRRGTWAESL